MNKEQKLARAKTVAKFVVGAGVHFVVTKALKDVVPIENKREKLKLLIGSYAIAGIVVRQATSFIEQEIDDAVETLDELKEMFQPTEEDPSLTESP